MPYIVEDKRNTLLPILRQLKKTLSDMELDDVDSNNTEGNINYIFSTILMEIYGHNPSYSTINDAMGILESCKQEFYRKVAAPYEEQKAYENGDLISLEDMFDHFIKTDTQEK